MGNLETLCIVNIALRPVYSSQDHVLQLKSGVKTLHFVSNESNLQNAIAFALCCAASRRIAEKWRETIPR